jgi:beta-phosphoglucomutase family hydrolase
MGDISRMLKLPEGIKACLFDLDGVITQTAKLHSAAWKEMFDAFLRQRAEETGEPFEEFTPSDYDRYVDGRPRLDGVRTFLEARGIEYDDERVRRLGDQKQELVLKLIRERGVEVYEGSLDFVREAQREGLRRAVVSSSANTREVLKSVGIEDLFEVVVDGIVANQEGLPGKPAPDTFVAGARKLGTEPPEAVVFEDALAGVEAGRAGGFGYVVGVDRTGQRDALAEHGADMVVDDLSELIER